MGICSVVFVEEVAPAIPAVLPRDSVTAAPPVTDGNSDERATRTASAAARVLRLGREDGLVRHVDPLFELVERRLVVDPPPRAADHAVAWVRRVFQPSGGASLNAGDIGASGRW